MEDDASSTRKGNNVNGRKWAIGVFAVGALACFILAAVLISNRPTTIEAVVFSVSGAKVELTDEQNVYKFDCVGKPGWNRGVKEGDKVKIRGKVKEKEGFGTDLVDCVLVK